MHDVLARRPSPAMVVALLALFVSLGGGAYAAVTLPKNSVGTKQLKNKAVTPTKVAPRTLALFKGHKGDTGPQGAQGIQGPQGIQGIQGPIGPSNAYFNSNNTLQTSVSVPAGDYVVYGQCPFTNSNGSSQPGLASLTSSAGGFGTIASVTIPANGSAEASDQGVLHLTAAGSIDNGCTGPANTGVVDNAVTAIRVGAASP